MSAVNNIHTVKFIAVRYDSLTWGGDPRESARIRGFRNTLASVHWQFGILASWQYGIWAYYGIMAMVLWHQVTQWHTLTVPDTMAVYSHCLSVPLWNCGRILYHQLYCSKSSNSNRTPIGLQQHSNRTPIGFYAVGQRRISWQLQFYCVCLCGTLALALAGKQYLLALTEPEIQMKTRLIS